MTKDSTIRGGVLDEAKLLIEGDRNKTYGSPTQNFQNTADIWTTLLRHKLKDGEVIDAYEVATLMIGLKLARTIAQPKRDNFTDMAGYAACGFETIEERNSPKESTARYFVGGLGNLTYRLHDGELTCKYADDPDDTWDRSAVTTVEDLIENGYREVRESQALR